MAAAASRKRSPWTWVALILLILTGIFYIALAIIEFIAAPILLAISGGLSNSALTGGVVGVATDLLLISAFVSAAVGVLYFISAYGVSRLRAWGKWLAIIMSVVAVVFDLLSFSLLTLIFAIPSVLIILALLVSKDKFRSG